MTNNKALTSGNSLLYYFIITIGFTWFFWLLGILTSLEVIASPFPSLVWVIIGAHGPLIGAFSLEYKSGGWAAVKKLLRAGFHLRLKLVWWIGIIAIPLVLAGLAMWLNVSLNNFEPDKTLLTPALLILPNFIFNFLFMFFLGGSFQEEFGWRGYALPRLLKTQSPFMASLILGIIWGLWHLPLFYISGLSQEYISISVFLPLTLAFSLIFTWVYLRTDRNLFTALLLHTAINTSLSVSPVEQEVGGNQMGLAYIMGLYFMVAAIIIIKERAYWFRKPSDNIETFPSGY